MGPGGRNLDVHRQVICECCGCSRPNAIRPHCKMLSKDHALAFKWSISFNVISCGDKSTRTRKGHGLSNELALDFKVPVVTITAQLGREIFHEDDHRKSAAKDEHCQTPLKHHLTGAIPSGNLGLVWGMVDLTRRRRTLNLGTSYDECHGSSFLFSARIMLFSSKKCDCSFITGNHSAAVLLLACSFKCMFITSIDVSDLLSFPISTAEHFTRRHNFLWVSSDHLNFKADVHEFLWSFRRFPKFYRAFKKTDLWRSRHKSRHYRPEVAYHKTINNKQGYW